MTINLPDGTWFDMDAAEEFKEDTYWNGNNHSSVATGSQWEHERLYKTKTGKYVLRYWSQWQGSGPGTYTVLDAATAAKWLLKHEHNEEAEKAVPGIIASTEV